MFAPFGLRFAVASHLATRRAAYYHKIRPKHHLRQIPPLSHNIRHPPIDSRFCRNDEKGGGNDGGAQAVLTYFAADIGKWLKG
ncbi:MAG: hypothetical protein ACR2P4_04930 [Gammaproteobacteria bacterium]